MKNTRKNFILASTFLFFIACNDEKRNEQEKKSTPATDQKTKEPSITVTTNDTTENVDVRIGPGGVNVSTKGSTSIDISSDGAKVETKTGTNVQVNEKGAKITTKDVKVRIGQKN